MAERKNQKSSVDKLMNNKNFKTFYNGLDKDTRRSVYNKIQGLKANTNIDNVIASQKINGRKISNIRKWTIEDVDELFNKSQESIKSTNISESVKRASSNYQKREELLRQYKANEEAQKAALQQRVKDRQQALIDFAEADKKVNYGEYDKNPILSDWLNKDIDVSDEYKNRVALESEANNDNYKGVDNLNKQRAARRKIGPINVVTTNNGKREVYNLEDKISMRVQPSDQNFIDTEKIGKLPNGNSLGVKLDSSLELDEVPKSQASKNFSDNAFNRENAYGFNINTGEKVKGKAPKTTKFNPKPSSLKKYGAYALGALAATALVGTMFFGDKKGEQSNAQLYGQQPLY